MWRGHDAWNRRSVPACMNNAGEPEGVQPPQMWKMGWVGGHHLSGVGRGMGGTT
jgi:hypothetical protein